MAIDRRAQLQMQGEEMAVIGRGIGFRNSVNLRHEAGKNMEQLPLPDAQIPILAGTTFPELPAPQDSNCTEQTPVQKILNLLGIHHR